MKRLSLSQRIGSAFVALFLSFSVSIGIPASTDAATTSGTAHNCVYDVRNDSFRTTGHAYSGCMHVAAYIEYRLNAAGTAGKEQADRDTFVSQTGQYLGSQSTITANYAYVQLQLSSNQLDIFRVSV